VPFILSHLFNPKKCELFCKPPTKKVNIASSIPEGISKYGVFGKPFVIRNVNIQLDKSNINFKFIGYDNTGKQHDDVDPKEQFSLWEQGQLKLNFVDSPAPKIISTKDTIFENHVKDNNLMFVLSNSGMYTPFHADPMYLKNEENIKKFGDQMGGGWMYLNKGVKMWQMLPVDCIEFLYDHELKIIKDLNISDLLYFNNNQFWGQIETFLLEDGDYLYFPPGHLHRVWTYKNSIGLAGYLDFIENEDIKLKGHRILKNVGVNVDEFPGVWFLKKAK